jgi:hypothetical protein
VIIAVNYRFHDYESESFIIDTALLDDQHLFESDVKKVLESEKIAITLDGEKYNDWGDLNKAKVNPPVAIDATKKLRVFWDC